MNRARHPPENGERKWWTAQSNLQVIKTTARIGCCTSNEEVDGSSCTTIDRPFGGSWVGLTRLMPWQGKKLGILGKAIAEKLTWVLFLSGGNAWVVLVSWYLGQKLGMLVGDGDPPRWPRLPGRKPRCWVPAASLRLALSTLTIQAGHVVTCSCLSHFLIDGDQSSHPPHLRRAIPSGFRSRFFHVFPHNRGLRIPWTPPGKDIRENSNAAHRWPEACLATLQAAVLASREILVRDTQHTGAVKVSISAASCGCRDEVDQILQPREDDRRG
jgi:hypothetical protein